MKYVYKTVLPNTSANVKTKKHIILWDEELLYSLKDGTISYSEFYQVISFYFQIISKKIFTLSGLY